MYKKCATEASAARQRQLEQGLLTAMSKRRYEEITVSELCEDLGIPRKSFYRYFSGKEGALHALIDHTLQEFEMEYIPAMIAERTSFQQGLEMYFRFWQEKKDFLDALQRSGLSGVLLERSITNAAITTMEESKHLLPERRSLKMETIMFALCGMTSMVVRWHHEGYAMDARSMSILASRLLTRPLFSEYAE